VETAHRGNNSAWLSVKRILFGGGFVVLAAYEFAWDDVTPLSDRVIYLSAFLLIFILLMWKRVYMYRHHEALIATAVPWIMLLASWIRHGPYTVAYVKIAIALLVLLLANLYFNRGTASPDEE
jgi:hypothetical protein